MTVLLRVKRSTDRRRARSHAPGHGAQAERPSAARAGRTYELGADPRTPPTQDRALYSCGCGYQFSQAVTTSVACPHCGDAQAW